MSYDAREHSVDGGAPIELYRFARGAGQAWLYTSADEPITRNNETYTPLTISRDRISHSSELNKANIQITVARDNAFAAEFVQQPPDGRVALTIFRSHRGDGEFVAYWKGRVLSVTWAGSSASIKAESLITSLKRAGLRPRFQALCRHALYGTGCFVNDQAFRIDGTLIGVNGTLISAAAWATKPDGWFTAGQVQFGEGGPRRLIRSHAGTDLKLSAPIPALKAGDVVAAYAGCDHTAETCETKFDNLLNNGGFQFVSTKNPFGSSGAS